MSFFFSLPTRIKTTYITDYSYGINFQWIVTPPNFANDNSYTIAGILMTRCATDDLLKINVLGAILNNQCQ